MKICLQFQLIPLVHRCCKLFGCRKASSTFVKERKKKNYTTEFQVLLDRWAYFLHRSWSWDQKMCNEGWDFQYLTGLSWWALWGKFLQTGEHVIRCWEWVIIGQQFSGMPRNMSSLVTAIKEWANLIDWMKFLFNYSWWLNSLTNGPYILLGLSILLRSRKLTF